MPPAVFVGASAGAAAASTWSFAVPAAAAIGDALLAVIADTDVTQGLNVPDGWTELVRIAGASAVVVVLRHDVDADDLSTVAIALDNAVHGAAALLVYRGLGAELAPIASGSADVAASTAFPCPSVALVHYADLYVGISFVSNAAAAVAPPAGTTERADVVGNVASELEVFDLQHEAVGATGTQTATTAVAHDGIAVGIALSVPNPPGLGLSWSPIVPGAIGFTTVGV